MIDIEQIARLAGAYSPEFREDYAFAVEDLERAFALYRAALVQEPVAWDNCRSEYQCRSWCGNSSCVSHPTPVNQRIAELEAQVQSLLKERTAGVKSADHRVNVRNARIKELEAALDVALDALEAHADIGINAEKAIAKLKEVRK